MDDSMSTRVTVKGNEVEESVFAVLFIAPSYWTLFRLAGYLALSVAVSLCNIPTKYNMPHLFHRCWYIFYPHVLLKELTPVWTTQHRQTTPSCMVSAMVIMRCSFGHGRGVGGCLCSVEGVRGDEGTLPDLHIFIIYLARSHCPFLAFITPIYCTEVGKFLIYYDNKVEICDW